ncbi:hypothetical protein [Aestuariimicrobium sp. T2.26MG-19.2B]|uniref:hypothetical protein n=1 Tax=Aestuariimicrobium sp. T2.26MG-19.2B TaxID=3040679 RepID=UPI00253FC2EF|nr:hypothetical protein [Aestuariimicrobium sp. T2.26MG-19.2B]
MRASKESIVDSDKTGRDRQPAGKLIGLLVALPGALLFGGFMAVQVWDAILVGATSEAILRCWLSIVICLAPVLLIPLFAPRAVGIYHVIAPILALCAQWSSIMLTATGF